MNATVDGVTRTLAAWQSRLADSLQTARNAAEDAAKNGKAPDLVRATAQIERDTKTTAAIQPLLDRLANQQKTFNAAQTAAQQDGAMAALSQTLGDVADLQQRNTSPLVALYGGTAPESYQARLRDANEAVKQAQASTPTAPTKPADEVKAVTAAKGAAAKVGLLNAELGKALGDAKLDDPEKQALQQQQGTLTQLETALNAAKGPDVPGLLATTQTALDSDTLQPNPPARSAKLQELKTVARAKSTIETVAVRARGERLMPQPGPGTNVTFDGGGHLSYGLSLSLLRFSTSRRPDQPARQRNYTPSLELVPAEFGFQFLYQPSHAPWRSKQVGGGEFQLIGIGGVLLAKVDNQHFERGGLSIAALVSFFDDTVGVGAGVDLYRGIPVQGPRGDSGGATAYTGLLAWGLATEGELTPENVFAVVSINLAGLAGHITGKAQ